MANIEVNKQAPDFQIEDYKGNSFKLSDFRGEKNVLIVLNRGFVWPFCKKHMMQLHQDFNKFLEKDTIILVVGPEKRINFEKYFEENGFEFYGIPDETQKVLKLFNQEVNLFKLGRMPAQMLIDKEGILKYVHFGHSMKDIPSNQEIFDSIDNMIN